MSDDYDFQAALRESDALVEQIRPILAGQSPEVTGTTIAQLVAIFVAGHAPELRPSGLKMLLDCAEGLVPVMVEEMIEAGRAPPEWRTDTKKQ
ncbi:hypothetical protein [Bradyrhizobium japonicum]|uniref:hypothetical protein n=1 Tax=Bradyrhizobium japonicum TaxID=375 RepID=UPI0020A2179A|nr:hypothetical protein [Bradyrhizobium japonicum]MCP1761920.1 hypothetical protein [Bradyrhizobium japonicum]MCP1793500.1 hypothetical protein [Bradyrhizobium japonicum]MCP1805933.1 hypothetical protein [Bradyrhizobium japonicum]MCP1812336.1 hypothetical protein [Bradyrhizobium japonicum]MCP1873621.1 hypothetical protein [Bradyrhizobium japonicum]